MKKIIPLLVFVVLATASYFGVRAFASNSAEEQINSAIENASEYADIKYDAVDVEPISQNVTMNNVVVVPKGSQDEIKVEKITISDIGKQIKQGDIPSRLAMSFKGLQMNAENFGDNIKMLKDLGYSDDLQLDLDIDYKYNAEKKDLKINKLAISVDDMLKLDLDLHMTGITIDPNNMESMMYGVMFSSLSNASIKFEDDSFVERLMQKTAEEEGVSVADLKKEMIEGMEQMMQSEDNNFVKSTFQAVKNFINKPDKISISASPSAPVNLGSLGMYRNNPAKIIEELKLEIE